MSLFKINVTVGDYNGDKDDILVDLVCELDGMKLTWEITDPYIYSIKFYKDLLKSMEQNTCIRKSDGGNSGSKIKFDGTHLSISVHCGGCGGDQKATLLLSKLEGISVVKQIIEGYNTSCEMIPVKA